MRRSMRMGVAAAAAMVVIGGFAAPASAAPTDSAGPASSIQVPDAPFNRTVTADYHRQLDGDVPVVPKATATLIMTLPPEVADMQLTAVTWSIRGATSGLEGTADVDGASGTISIPLTGGLPKPRNDSVGTGYFTYRLDSNQDLLDPPHPPQSSSDPLWSRTATLRAYGAFYLGDAGTDPVTTLDLASANATSFSSTQSYWGQAPDVSWMRAGDSVSVVREGLDWAAGTTAAVAGSAATVTTGGDADVLDVSIPVDADLSNYIGFNRASTLSVTETQGVDVRHVFAPVTIAAPTSVAGIDASRISGDDRFATASAIANAQYPGGVDTVFVATGDTFADALSIAPVAALHGSPVMLASGDLFYQEPNLLKVAQEIGTLSPAHLVFIGGEQSIPWVWEPGLSYGCCGTQVRTVQRIAGADRYEVSRNIALQEFPGGAKTVFLASGLTFSDALSAVPSAVTQGAPVILVRGGSDSLDSQTTDVLQQLGATKVVIVGGPASVSTGIESQLKSRYSPAGVTRFGGVDRFAVANAVNRAYFPSAPTAYFATGLRFTDALTGGVMAAKEHAPLLLSRTECVPPGDLDSLSRWKTSKVTLFGGTDSLNPTVMNLQSCG